MYKDEGPDPPTSSTMTPASEAKGKRVEINQFYLTDIPNTMQRKGWLQGARFMRRWFAAPAFELPLEYKTGSKSASTLAPAHVLEDLPIRWLQSASSRVWPTVEEIVKEFQHVDYHNNRLGKVYGIVDNLSKGLIILMKRIDRMGLIDHQSSKLRTRVISLPTSSALQLDDTSQFNLEKFGEYGLFDALDDVFAALGAFSLKMAATDFNTYVDDRGYSIIQINEIGLYVRDTYDFLNEDGEDQKLGFWNKNDVKKGAAAIFSDVVIELPEFYWKVTNNDFNEYRRLFSLGGDFIAFSTVERFSVDITIRLNAEDFEEYSVRKNKI